MSSSTAQEYIEQLGDEPQARLALLACSAALRLDDETAHAAVEIVAQSNGSTARLLRRVKNLGCVWKEWDGSWHVTEDVRHQLFDRLYNEIPEATHLRLRRMLAGTADSRAALLPPDGQVTSHDKLLLHFEAAYQRVLIPKMAAKGAVQLVELWQQSPLAVANATARSVDYLADELDRRLHRLPDEILFLRGMAARSRGDLDHEEKYFRAVWEKRRYGFIYGVAAHLFALVIQYSNPKTAETALRDSLKWYSIPSHRAQVFHSLGNLLARERSRYMEAERAYRESLKLLTQDLEHVGMVYHSLGNLLMKNAQRWSEAEEAYKQSIDFAGDNYSRAQRFHSLGKLLLNIPNRWEEAELALEHSFNLYDANNHRAQVLATWANALSGLGTGENDSRAEEYARKGIELDPTNPRTCGIFYHVLTLIYERRGDYERALETCRSWKDANQKRRDWRFVKEAQAKIDELSQRVKKDRKSKL